MLSAEINSHCLDIIRLDYQPIMIYDVLLYITLINVVPHCLTVCTQIGVCVSLPTINVFTHSMPLPDYYVL